MSVTSILYPEVKEIKYLLYQEWWEKFPFIITIFKGSSNPARIQDIVKINTIIPVSRSEGSSGSSASASFHQDLPEFGINISFSYPGQS